MVFHEKITARITPNPVTFGEAFRKVGETKIGGSPKTTAAVDFLFRGNLGSGIIFLRSRVRLIDPNKSFYTYSIGCEIPMSAAPAIGSTSRCGANAPMTISP